MVTLNRAFNELSCKLVYYGPGMGGKTTNLEQIHGQVPENYRGDLVSLATESDRTLFFDFLPLDLGDIKGMKTKFQLFTVPGQVYYNATRKLVLAGVDGVVFVADSQASRIDDNRESLQNLRENLAEHDYDLDTIAWVLQYNKRDHPDAMPVEEMQAMLNPGVDYFEAIAIECVGVKETLKCISAKVLNKLRAQMEDGAPQSELAAKAARRTKPKAPPAAPAIEGDIPLPSAAALSAQGVAVPENYPRSAQSAPAKQAAAEERSPAPKLSIIQTCDVHWLGITIGSARISLANLEVDVTPPTYMLEGDMRMFGLSRSSLNRILYLRGHERLDEDGQSAPFMTFDDQPGDAAGGASAMRVWVKNAKDKNIYLERSGWVGNVVLTPAGKPAIL